MARLLIRTPGLENRTLELRLGVNRVGRDPESDFPIIHSTISADHCEIVVTADGILLRDCGSTNGTFVNGDQIKEAWLMRGQEVRLGDVELFVESTEINVVIPEFDRERLKPPTLLEGGMVACNRHSRTPALYKCNHCHDVMCNQCIKIMRIKGGQALFLCPSCSHKCEMIQIAAPEKKKRGFIAFLQDTVKLKFGHHATREKLDQ